MLHEGDLKSGSDKFVERDEKQEQKSAIVEDDMKETGHKITTVNDELEMKIHEDSLTAGNAHFSTSLCPDKKEISSDMEGERQLNLINFKEKTNVSSIGGVYTVLCIDTSDTMKLNDAWGETKAFVNDFGKALSEEYEMCRTHFYTAVVTFGEETKVQQQLTKDLSLVRDVIENTELGGDSKLEAGLRFSKDVVLSVNNYVFTVNKTRILPRIIVITDGRAIVQNQSQLTGNEKFNRLKEEMTGIREKNIEIHFVYVGDPDYIFLHKLREISKGELSPHTTGLRMANDALLKQILYFKKDFLTSQLNRENIDESDASTEHDDGESLDGLNRENIDESDASTEHDDGEILDGILEMCHFFVKDGFGKRILNDLSTMWELLIRDEDFNRCIPSSLASFFQTMLFKHCDYSTIEERVLNFDQMDLVRLVEAMGSLFEVIKNKFNPNRYKEETYLQQHAPIGCRVRRGQDWKWANQDNGGPGTIIGHLYDELSRYWCWVEWDIGGHINAYRWDVLGKCDLAIVDEERVPVEGDISVGCKVRPGDSYEGNSSHELGIAIKRLDDTKIQVRWKDDGSREDLTYGKDGTPKQVMLLCVVETKEKTEYKRSQNDPDKIPVSVDSALKNTYRLASPVRLKVDDVFETTATVRWLKSIDDKSSSSKYVVTYKEKNKPQKKIAVEVVASFFCILDDLKPETEYYVDVKLINDDGESTPTESSSFITRRIDTDEAFYADWKLTEKEAARLSQAIGVDWEILAPELGLPNIIVHHIRGDNNTMALCIYKMLLKWVQSDSNSTFGKLCEVLKKFPNVYVERSIIDQMKEEYRLIKMEKE